MLKHDTQIMVKAKQIALERQILSQHQISMRSWISPNYLEKYHTLRDSSVPNTLLLLLLLLQNSRGIIDCTTEMQLMYETITIGEHASSGSSSEVSQSMPLIPRIPPIAISTVVSPRETLPYLDFISFSRSCGKSFKLVLKSPTKYHLLEKKNILESPTETII
jgi:hypothetical protein